MKRLLLILAVFLPCLLHGQARYPNYFSTNAAPFSVVPGESMYVPIFRSTNGVFTNLTVTGYLFIGTAQVNYLQMLGALNQQGGSGYSNIFMADASYFRGTIQSTNGVVLMQRQTIPTNSIPRSSALVTNFVLINLTNTINGGGPMYVATNINAAGSFILAKPAPTQTTWP